MVENQFTGFCIFKKNIYIYIKKPSVVTTGGSTAIGGSTTTGSSSTTSGGTCYRRVAVLPKGSSTTDGSTCYLPQGSSTTYDSTCYHKVAVLPVVALATYSSMVILIHSFLVKISCKLKFDISDFRAGY